MSDEQIPIAKLIKVFLKIKAQRAVLKQQFDEQDKPLEEQQKMIKRAMLDFCRESGQDSAKVKGVGRITRSIKKKYWASDWEEFNKFILEHETPEFYAKTLNGTNIQSFLDENPDVKIPGLHIDPEYVISVYSK